MTFVERYIEKDVELKKKLMKLYEESQSSNSREGGLSKIEKIESQKKVHKLT